MKPSTPTSIDEYSGRFPLAVREVLAELRDLVRATVPEVTERISYGIPTFDLDGRYLVYIAGWRKYVCVYPATAAVRRALVKSSIEGAAGRTAAGDAPAAESGSAAFAWLTRIGVLP